MCKESEKREIFLENLPRWENGRYKDKINWKESIGKFVKFRYEDIQGEVEIIDYEIVKEDLYIKYLNKKPFKINTTSFKDCKLGRLIGKITNEFKYEIGDVIKDDRRNIIIIDKKHIMNKSGYKERYYKYRCNNCGFECGEYYKNGDHHEEYWIVESSLKNSGCACCCNSPKIVVSGINDILTTTPWMMKYFQNPEDAKKYSKSSSQKIYPICPECNRIKNKPISINNIYHDKSIGCSCSDSQPYPEKLIFNILEQIGIDFTYQYQPNYIKPRRYDFYIEINENDMIHKYIIETDGRFHKEDNNYVWANCGRI